jgi:hypothetical protein
LYALLEVSLEHIADRDPESDIMTSIGLRQAAVFFLFLLAGCVDGRGGEVPSGSLPRWYSDPGTQWGP